MTNDTLSTPKLSTPRHANQYGSFGQGEEEEHQFGSIDEEAAFYRNKYRHAADLLDETRNELDEFQTSSRELEEELEKELAATEKHQAEFQDRIAKLEVEKEEWKTKHVALQKTHSSTTAAMQREMDNLRRERDKTLVALRDLEVGNDELERHGRVAASSLLDMESKLNRAIEDKTLLEQEVVIKGELEDQIQRLKTDLRDSADQVSILKDQLARATFPTPPSSVSVPISPSQSSSHLSEPDIVSTGHSARPPLSGEGSPLPPAVPPKSPLTLSGSRTASLNMSPNTAKRLASGIPSPSMSRAVSSRNLSGSAATSPTIRRTASTIGNGRPSAPAPPPAASKGLGANARTKLAALRSRLKATDDRLGNQMGPRVVSGASDGASRKVSSASVVSAASISALSVASTSAIHTRVTELADKRAGGNGYKTPEAPAGVLSPTGWVLADPDVTPGAFDSGDDTPLAHKLGVSIRPSDPDSPLVNARPGSRATSTTTAGSSRTARLPSRTAVPSPLMNMAAASAARMRESTKDGDKSRPPVSSALSRSNVLAAALQADPNAGYDLESSTRPAGRMRSVTASTASGAPSETSDRAPSRASTVLSRSTRAPSRNSAASPSFDEYTSADRSEPPPIPISGERHTLSRSVRAPSRSGASGGGGTPVPRPSSRVSATGSSRPLSPAAGATSGLPRSAYPLINSTTAGIGRSPGPGMTRSSTVSFNALAEQLSAKRGTEAYARIGQPDSRPTSRATGAVSSGSASSAAVPAAAVGAGRDRRVSHGRSQSTMASLGRGAPPVPSIPSSSTAGQMTRSGLTSSTSTRRLADRPTIASANRTTPPATASDDLRKSVRAGVSTTRSTRASTLNPQSQGQGPGVSGDEDEGDDADTTLTGIPRFGQGSVLGTSTSTRTPRESPGTGNKRPMSMQHYGTPPEMPQLPGGLGPGVRSAQR